MADEPHRLAVHREICVHLAEISTSENLLNGAPSTLLRSVPVKNERWGRSDGDIPRIAVEGVSKICAQLESDVRFSDTLEYFRRFGVSRDAFQVVLDQLLIGELNWAHVFSIVALSGSLAVQCAEKGEEKKIDLVRDWAASFAEVKLAPWIEANHGMEGLRQYFHLRGRDVSHWERNKLLAAGACAAVGVIIVGLFASERAGG